MAEHKPSWMVCIEADHLNKAIINHFHSELVTMLHTEQTVNAWEKGDRIDLKFLYIDV